MVNPVLKCEKVVHISVDYSDLEEFIQQIYNKPDYSLVASEEWGNDEQHTIELYKNNEFQAKALKDWLNGKRHNFILRTIMNDLLEKGLLEKGEYLINICW